MNLRDELLEKYQKSEHSVALLSPNGIGTHGEIVRGFILQNESEQRVFRVYPFYSRGLNSDNIRICLEDILNDDFDLLVTVGVRCARLAIEVVKNKNSSIPVISVGANFPEIGDVSQCTFITGITYGRENVQDRGISFLIACKPYIKEVLLPCEPDSLLPEGSKGYPMWLADEIRQISEKFKKVDIGLNVACVTSMVARFDYVKRHIESYDTILLVEGTISLDMHRPLANLCNNHGVTLFSGLTEAVRYGSAIGYGADFAVLGEKAVEYAQKILFDKVPPQELPFYKVEKIRKPAVNLALAERQGLDSKHIEKVCREWGGDIFTEAGVDKL